MSFLTNEKLVIVGAGGMIGSNMAQSVLTLGLTPNVCLYDIFEPGLHGVADEIAHCGFPGANVTWTTDPKEAFIGAKYIISSGGAPRKEGMTREDLLKVRDLWGDLLSCLNPQEQALLSQSTVNAAGPNGFVLGFAYDHLCDISETRPGFREVIQGHLERLGGYSGTFVAVTQHQWPQIRADFLQERKKNQEEEAVSIVTEEPAVEDSLTPEEQAFEQKVNDTIELFGEEIVQIEE